MDSESKRFARHNKLVKPGEFQRVFKLGNLKSKDRCFVVLALENELEFARLGLTVAKKNVASSVERNRIKRIIRESFRLHKNIICKLDSVVIVRRGTDKLDNREISSALEKHWQRLAKYYLAQ